MYSKGIAILYFLVTVVGQGTLTAGGNNTEDSTQIPTNTNSVVQTVGLDVKHIEQSSSVVPMILGISKAQIETFRSSELEDVKDNIEVGQNDVNENTSTLTILTQQVANSVALDKQNSVSGGSNSVPMESEIPSFLDPQLESVNNEDSMLTSTLTEEGFDETPFPISNTTNSSLNAVPSSTKNVIVFSRGYQSLQLGSAHLLSIFLTIIAGICL
ncbi:hypothetical protein AX774_g102 [Zancudomyces culisetae]|uniref:Uncharacterized protein n=1 Tax=Zancudomyces culisetae TaxID=1213189 RepID=A0A1R1PZH0_ZANCU|nr:hypothetical protein AX774_g102 [Zancudomyces culisetae]|eukprot:OMH86344.1 hypothetical protein AX774_g102 [Zancudomyces culisetae]